MLMRPSGRVLCWDAMEYRLYRLDRITQHIVSARDVMAEDDGDALKEAEKLCQTHAIEIWQGTRYVALIDLAGTARHPQHYLSC